MISCYQNDPFLQEEQVCEDVTNACNDQSIRIDTLKSHRKVLIIGIDGLRSDGLNAENTPYIHTLTKKENVYINRSHTTERITISGPNWASILSGTHTCKHRVINNSFKSNKLIEFPIFFKYVKSAYSSITTSSIVHWTPLNQHLLLDYSDHANAGGVADLEVFERARNMLLSDDPIAPDLLFLHFVDLDVSGHRHGYNSRIWGYANTLATLDNYVEGLVSIIESKRKEGEDWLVIVISDHGGDGKGHFDYSNPKIRNTIFLADHPDIQFNRNLTSTHVDVAPTIMDFIGITSEEFNCKTDGVSLISF